MSDEMTKLEEKLRLFIKENDIEAEQISFAKSVHSVEEAAEALKAKPSDLIKSVILVQDDEVIVAIVSGEDRVSPERVAKVIGSPAPKMARPIEVLRYTGYPVGGVPPFGYKAKFLIDRMVIKKQVLYGGGGSPRSLVKIRPDELLRVTRAIVADIRDERGVG